MNNQFETQLAADFPSLFHYDTKSGQRLEPPNGLWVPKGWKLLVYRLCWELNYLSGGLGFTIKLTQIKEKLGGLRVYIYHPEDSPAVRSLINFAESLSSHTCEETGNKGRICSKDGLLKTLSPEIAARDGFTPVNKQHE